MQTLIVNAHPDPHAQDSATHHMVQRLLGHLPSGSAQALNLADADVPPLDKELRTVFVKTVLTEKPLNATEQALAARTAALVAQLKSAPRLVIAMPIYNLGIPAPLKQWLDNIVIPGQTFRYNEEGRPQGLMAEHKALVLLSSGGIYSQGDFAHMDFATPYLQGLLGGLLGFGSVEVVRAEGMQVPGMGMDKALESAFAQMDALLPGFIAS